MDTTEARQSRQFLNINSSDVEVLMRQGRRLAKLILQSHQPSLGQVIDEIVHRAEKKPSDIDSLLRIYLALTEELGSDPTVESRLGKTAAIQEFEKKVYERYVTLIEANRHRTPWDGLYRTSEPPNSRKAMERVLAHGEMRRSAFILQALRGRAMALGLQSGDNAVSTYTSPSTHIHMVCSEPEGVTDDTELIGEVVLVLAAGHFLAPPQASVDSQIMFLQRTRNIFEERLRAPSCGFRQKHITAHAVKALYNGGKPWSSADLFGETTWVG